MPDVELRTGPPTITKQWCFRAQVVLKRSPVQSLRDEPVLQHRRPPRPGFDADEPPDIAIDQLEQTRQAGLSLVNGLNRAPVIFALMVGRN